MIWPQATLLFSENLYDLDSIKNHIHYYRFLIALPGLFFNHLIKSDLGGSVYINTFCYFNFFLLSRISVLTIKKKPYFIISFLFFLAHLTMNGRGVCAFFSWLICVFCILSISKNNKISLKIILFMIISIFLSSVSTGVMFTISSSIIIFLSFFLIKNIMIRNFCYISSFFIFYNLFFLDCFINGIKKNALFYNGLINTLNHGFGAIFFVEEKLILLFFILLFIFFIFFIFFYFLKMKKNIFNYFLSINVLSGAFGYLLFSLIIPTLLIILNQCIGKKIKILRDDA